MQPAGTWLRLTDYAARYRVSISTLRRRIKAAEIPYRFEDGKYLILDTQTAPAQSTAAVEAAPLKENAQEKLDQLRATAPTQEAEEPILSSATRLLSELKRAYMNILHEKEEQMIQLKEEVCDLKTLVRALEDDNNRMRSRLSL